MVIQDHYMNITSFVAMSFSYLKKKQVVIFAFYDLSPPPLKKGEMDRGLTLIYYAIISSDSTYILIC